MPCVYVCEWIHLCIVRMCRYVLLCHVCTYVNGYTCVLYVCVGMYSCAMCVCEWIHLCIVCVGMYSCAMFCSYSTCSRSKGPIDLEHFCNVAQLDAEKTEEKLMQR